MRHIAAVDVAVFVFEVVMVSLLASMIRQSYVGHRVLVGVVGVVDCVDCVGYVVRFGCSVDYYAVESVVT